jgi:hypothetical protein
MVIGETSKGVMEVVNCTPHDLKIITRDGVITVERSGILPRVQMTKKVVDMLQTDEGRIPVIESCTGEVVDLPPELPGIRYIVSALVAMRAPHRDDLLIVEDTVRDERGNVQGCRALARAR